MARDSALVTACNFAEYSNKQFAIAYLKSGRVVHGLIRVRNLSSAIMIGNEFVNEDAVETVGCYEEADYIALIPSIGKLIK
jgi:hypothetical protein